MRRFEMVEGSTSKFWEVAVDGATLTTGYGRIGTGGQTKSKTVADEAAALKERDALVREKTGKGYVEVGGVSTPDPRPAAVTSPPPPPMRADESAAAVMAAAPTAEIDSTALLRGGFQWAKGELESLPLALRDVHVPEAPDVAALMAAPLQFREEHVSQEARALIPKLIEIYTVDHVSAATDEEWALLLRTARHASFAKQSDRGYGGDWSFGSRWLIETGLAQCGLLHVLRQVMTYVEVVALTGLGSEDLFRGMLPPLRRSIASAEWPQYVEAMEFLDSLSKQPELTQLVRAWIAPSVPLWAAALIQSQPPCDLKLPLLACPLPVDKLLAYLEHQLPCEDQEPLADELRAGVLLQMAEQSQETLPLLVWLARRLTQDRKVFIEWMTRLHVPDMPQALAGLIEYPEARAALHALARRFPAAVLHGVATHAFEHNDAVAREWALQLALKQPEAVAPAMAVLSDDHRRHLAQLIAASRREEAPLDALPDWLRAPPWVTGARAPALPTLALPAAVRAPALSWPDKDRARWIQRAATPAALPPDQTVETLLAGWYIQPAGIERLKRGEPLQLPGDLAVDPGTGYRQSIWHFPTLPAPVLLAMWNSYPGEMWHEDLYDHVTAIVALHGLDALPGLESYAAAHASSDLPVALRVDSPGLAVTVLQTLRTSKRQKSRAAAWLTRYPETAAAAALPLAFGKDKTARLNGQWGLQWLMAHGFDAQVAAAAAAAGPEATKAVEALRGADPLLDLPARMPELPAFFARAALNAPALRSTGAALPVGIVHHLGMMLAVSTVESPYAGLKAIKALCTPASLAAFAQGLFDAWEAEGAPHKEVWAFQALGLLGDDDIAWRLAGRIREWPGQSASQRAMAGLDLLVAIGSDTALMHLNGIATQSKFAALKARAVEKIDALAQARGLTAEELSDRLVPSLGLDEQGALRLDFGPRHFSVHFDETLKPFVRDGAGVRLKDLPKPNGADDRDMAADAVQRYKQLKKEAAAIASLQIARLELAMANRRRWSAQDFQRHVLGHPLMRHLAGRIVWGVYEDDRVSRLFRVAEDATLADLSDAVTSLNEADTVGIVHPVELETAQTTAMGQVFADYEILQPFPQLGRETFALTTEELGGDTLVRFADKSVSVGSLKGLMQRGWARGPAGDGGWFNEYRRALGGDREIRLEISPGTLVSMQEEYARQQLPRVTLRSQAAEDGELRFDALHPVVVSEVVRDLALLAEFEERG